MLKKRMEMPMTCPHRLLRALILLAALACLLAGCGKSEAPGVDPQPFEAAVAWYLDQNNMGVPLKDIKAGPTVEGQTATLIASLHHATTADVAGIPRAAAVGEGLAVVTPASELGGF
jgi:hypothetical protein